MRPEEVELEIQTLEEEGYRVDVVRTELEEYWRTPHRYFSELLHLYTHLDEVLPRRPGYQYREPTDYRELVRESCVLGITGEVSRTELEDRIRGGFLGKVVGCMLGRPVEGWSGTVIRERLRRLGEYPLRNYLPQYFFTEEELRDPVRRVLTREHVSGMVRDDDIDYVILNLEVVRRYGLTFRTEDVGRTWLELLPYHLTYTAERAAYRNLVLGLKPPLTALFLNPYREFVGARIRVDTWGYLSPGNPEQARELAYRDAVLSHVRNGVYSAVMAATMVAHAYVADTVEEVVEVGLRAIPQESRLAEAIRKVLDLWRRGVEWEEAIEELLSMYRRYHPVHCIPNDIIVVAALLWGEGDFVKSVSLAVMAGLDTDCNTATVGSITGVLRGYRELREKARHLLEPLGSRLVTAVWSYNALNFDDITRLLLREVLKYCRRSGS